MLNRYFNTFFFTVKAMYHHVNDNLPNKVILNSILTFYLKICYTYLFDLEINNLLFNILIKYKIDFFDKFI